MNRCLLIVLAGLLLGGCGSMTKPSPGELVAQRVQPEPATAVPVRLVADDAAGPTGERQPLDALIPDSAMVCVPAHLVQVQLRGVQVDPAVPASPSREEAGAPAAGPSTAAPQDEAAELERLQGLAQQLLAARK